MAQDWLIAFALMLVIEGLLYSLFPGMMRKALQAALDASVDALRIGGLIAIIVGVLIVWIVKA
ncbi:MAG: DUF2065 domain-containing protein [Pseudomonadota bacterium]